MSIFRLSLPADRIFNLFLDSLTGSDVAILTVEKLWPSSALRHTALTALRKPEESISGKDMKHGSFPHKQSMSGLVKTMIKYFTTHTKHGPNILRFLRLEGHTEGFFARQSSPPEIMTD